MTTEELVIAAIRVAGSLPVLRWPFYGALLAIFVDLSDLFWMDALHLGGVRDYQAFDKRIDLMYMAAFLAVALRWQGLARSVALALFAWRAIGLTAFEVTGERAVLLAAPNVFEFWFVLVAARDRFRLRYALTPRRAALWLVPLTAAKETQEYVLHFWRGLDEYGFFEFWARVWQALTPW